MPYHVADEELIRSLEQSLSVREEGGTSIVRLDRRLSDYCSSFTIEELRVELEEGRTLSLIFKNLSWPAIIKEARGVKPEFLYEPNREIGMYEAVLPSHDWGTAHFYGGMVDSGIQRYWLFLEHIPGEKLRFVGEFDTWLRASRWLARMHAAYQMDSAQLNAAQESARLLRYDAMFYYRWMERAGAYLHRIASDRNRSDHLLFVRLADRYDRAVSALAALPRTLIHGDFFASNVLVVNGGEAPRICPVDWELSAVGPGLVDLAALIAGGWSDDERLALARGYYEEMARAGIPMAPFEDYIRSLNLCRLHLAVQWLGWSTEWTPPSEERQDWLYEALHLADQLGLLS